jgi:glycosyltransferase involved in cell wall biosynthesis
MTTSTTESNKRSGAILDYCNRSLGDWCENIDNPKSCKIISWANTGGGAEFFSEYLAEYMSADRISLRGQGRLHFFKALLAILRLPKNQVCLVSQPNAIIFVCILNWLLSKSIAVIPLFHSPFLKPWQSAVLKKFNFQLALADSTPTKVFILETQIISKVEVVTPPIRFFYRLAGDKTSEVTPHNKMTVHFVGRRHPVKRFHWFQDAARSLNLVPEFSSILFKVHGSGYDEFASSYPKDIEYLGHNPHWALSVEPGDLIVCCSALEGFGMAIFEGMLAGALPVSTKVGELWSKKHIFNGKFYDTPRELVDAIAELYKMPRNSRALKANQNLLWIKGNL